MQDFTFGWFARFVAVLLMLGCLAGSYLQQSATKDVRKIVEGQSDPAWAQRDPFAPGGGLGDPSPWVFGFQLTSTSK